MSFPYGKPATGPISGTLRLGRVLGIELRVHPLFLYMYGILVFASAAFGDPSIPMPTRVANSSGILLALAVIVLLHEYGHSLVARRFGIEVIDITLWPLGGMARMAEIPEDSRVEGLVAIAGPAVNFVLAGAFAAILFATTGNLDVLDYVRQASSVASLPHALSIIILINLAIGLFNLVPAFPMDGGRILRAFLGRKGNYLEATERAVSVGRFCAMLMVVGFFFGGGCALPLIGLYVFYAGTRELWTMRIKHAAAGGGGVNPLEEFLRNRGAGFGFGSPTQGPEAAGDEPRHDHEPIDAEPFSPSAPPTASSGGGFSEADIERLERFHGRLRNPGGDESR